MSGTTTSSSAGKDVLDEESMEPLQQRQRTQKRVVVHAYDEDASRFAENLINKKWGGLLLALVVLSVIMVLLPNHQVSNNQNAIVEYQCPATVETAPNDEQGHFTKDYLSSSGGKSNVVNITDFLFNENFRKADYDNWGKSYEQVKKGMYHWKSTMFPDAVNEGDSIYESACGIGLNLFMTLEIIHEIKGYEEIVVYGNEYLEESVTKANAFFDMAAPFHSKKGRICQGDSTHSQHVPAESFDLVFTGYITPIYDPIKLENGTISQNYQIYKRFCESNDWKDKKLSSLAQEKQEDFYASWVGEMVRIAKPGEAVIIEQVSMPYCDEYLDWGGVRLEWWEPAIDKYGWDIDPTSIEMEKDEVFRNRYHVFMRKNE